MSADWTRDELAAAVDAYLGMLASVDAGEAPNKAAIRRELMRGSLSERSEKAIEFRFCNISHVFDREGKRPLSGYVPLKHVGPGPYAIIAELLEERGVLSRDDYRPTASDRELRERTNRLLRRGKALPRPQGQESPEFVETTHRVFKRDPAVRAYVLQRAAGKCELCECTAPFKTVQGEPYLEAHHIVSLADGGPDTVKNTAALCPTCHRRAHYGFDADELRTQTQSRIDRLESD